MTEASGGEASNRALALARRIAAAGASTLLQNGFMFALGLVLVRGLRPEQFGVYTMLVTVLSIAGVLLSALVAQQMGYALPRASHAAVQRSAGRMFGSVAALCILVTVPATLLVLAYHRIDPLLLGLGTLYVASNMYRTYARFYFFSLRRPQRAMRQDLLFVGVSAVGVAVVAIGPGLRDRLALVLGVMAAANLLCSVVLSDAPRPAGSRRLLGRQLRAYRRHTRRAFWSLTTVLLSTLSIMSPNLAVMATGSLVSLAVITAPGSALAPIRIVTVTLQTSLRAEFSALLHAGSVRPALLLYAAATIAGGAVGLGVAPIAWFAWDPLYHLLFSHGYDYAEIRRATLISIAIVGINTMRFPGSVLLNASNVFAYSAAVLAVVAPVAVVLAFVLARSGEVTDTLFGALFGEVAIFVAELGAIVWLFGVKRRTGSEAAVERLERRRV